MLILSVQIIIGRDCVQPLLPNATKCKEQPQIYSNPPSMHAHLQWIRLYIGNSSNSESVARREHKRGHLRQRGSAYKTDAGDIKTISGCSNRCTTPSSRDNLFEHLPETYRQHLLIGRSSISSEKRQAAYKPQQNHIISNQQHLSTRSEYNKPHDHSNAARFSYKLTTSAEL